MERIEGSRGPVQDPATTIWNTIKTYIRGWLPIPDVPTLETPQDRRPVGVCLACHRPVLGHETHVAYTRSTETQDDRAIYVHKSETIGYLHPECDRSAS